MKKLILIFGLVIGMSSFVAEATAQPPHAKAWGKRYKNWDKGSGKEGWRKDRDRDDWNENRNWNRKHYNRKVIKPVIWRDHSYSYQRPVHRGAVINARARF